MKKYRLFYVLAFVLLMGISLNSGCGDKSPKGFPKTFPFELKITNGSAPIEKANVRMIAQNGGGSWVVSGVTDASGTAVMQTVSGSYSKKGVPEGEFKVVLEKPVVENWEEILGPRPSTKAGEVAYNNKVSEYIKNAPKEIPPVYSDGKTTPATITVAKGTKSETIDVGKN